MKKKGIIIVSVIILIIIILVVLVIRRPVSCNNLYNEIEADMDRYNYCNVDGDCDSLGLGGIYIAFGCYHYINKNVDKNLVLDKMEIYDSKCNLMINDCMSAPNASCVNGKCVEHICGGHKDFVDLNNYSDSKYYPDKCCEGFVPLYAMAVNSSGNCEILTGTPFAVCMPCGNGKCNNETGGNNFVENSCNCPADCS